MDILYIVGKDCSICDNIELRMSLRSIEQYGKNVGRVYVAGYCPDWLSNKVIKIPFEQPYTKIPNMTEKHINMVSTLLYAVHNSDIGDEFLLSMDDHFYINDVDFDNYPFYAKIHNGGFELPCKNDGDGKNPYNIWLSQTRLLCDEENISSYFFCPHRNMHMSKEIIEECRPVLERVIKEKIPCETFAFMLNWRYTKYGFEITPCEDVKIRNASDWEKVNPRYTDVFSTANFLKDNEIYNLLVNTFKNKSKYERICNLKIKLEKK